MSWDNSHCACVSESAKECLRIRYGTEPDDSDEDGFGRCECACHSDWIAIDEDF